jgi:hypothetical protein
MLHAPNSDNLPITTNELVCVLVNRLDAPSSLFSLLALMTEVSDALPIDRQYRMAATLRDAADMIEARPVVREWAARLGLTLTYYDEGPRCR